MTLSALANTFGGIVSPICFAAFKLMTNSNFVGCSTGRSADLASQHKDCISMSLACRTERRLNVVGILYFQILKLDAERPCSEFRLSQRLSVAWNGCISQHGHAGELGDDLLQEFQSLAA